MTTNTEATSWRLTTPLYTYADAARIIGLPSATVRVWIEGSVRRDGTPREPLFGTPHAPRGTLSFLQLIELEVATRLRKKEGAKMAPLRRAHANARQQLELEYPFAHIKLSAIGGHVVHLIRDGSPGGPFPALDALEQSTLPGLLSLTQMVRDELDFSGTLATRWWPEGKGCPIVLDPSISSGVPTIEGRRLTVELVYIRCMTSEEPVEFIMRDLDLDQGQIDAALAYGERFAA